MDVNRFAQMHIGLASPEIIRGWSHGEVKKPETINYRTLKPEKDGLFCERIFGPVRDWECHCGKYKRIRYKGMVCDRCGVEITRARVRRERMGHIELAAPVSHIWYFKGIPSKLGLILDMTPRNLEKVLYFAAYIVLDEKETTLTKKQILSESEYAQAIEEFGPNGFKAGMGAEAIQILLKELDDDNQKKLIELNESLREELKALSAKGVHASNQKRQRITKRLEVIKAFRKSHQKVSWMIMDVIPVIPPELRPMVQLEGGRFATSDLNDLYRRVINRNNRLKRLLELNAPEIIIRNEKRMLQESVDALIDNGRRGRPLVGPANRPLKSLSDMLKGKQGRFRQNLLGKRVDYSGRSVIVVGPELKLHQCGLPKEMALELFKPFVMKKLQDEKFAGNIKTAKKAVERQSPEVWDVLEDVIKEHPVLLNRAPTLHRLGIQAFEPILTEGKALRLHPLACTAFNADFDGDQMAIHLPLSVEAQAEARILMLAAHHILAPKDGKPIIVPTQDMILGSYYLTILNPNAKGTGKKFVSMEEALLAYHWKELDLQAEVWVRLDLPKLGQTLVKTSLGRMIFNEVLPPEIRYLSQDEEGTWIYGKRIDKKEMSRLVANCFKHFDAQKTAEVIDKVKNLGYHYACLAGMTVAISDVIVPPEKPAMIAKTKNEVNQIERQYMRGLMTEQERYKKVVALWQKTTDDVGEAMMKNMDKFNPIFMMADSGARGNAQQMRQLAGMRGLMADPSGKIIDLPITANFREGLTVSDYFISSHGARKGLTDTALRTADSGYLTRRLVDVSQDLIVRDADCHVQKVNLKRLRAKLTNDVEQAINLLKEDLLGCVLAQDILDPATEDIILPKDTTLTTADFEKIAENGVPELVIRGSLDKENLTNALTTETISLGVSDEEEKVRVFEEIALDLVNKEWIDDDGNKQLLTKELCQELLDSDRESISVTTGKTSGTWVQLDLAHKKTIHEKITGRCLAEDVLVGETVLAKEGQLIDSDLADKFFEYAKEGKLSLVKVRTVLTCHCRYGVCQKCYGSDLANGEHHLIEIGESVGIIAAQSIGEPGTQLTMRTFHSGGVAGDDITQGLPRVEELFEARKPKHTAILAEISGKVSITWNKENSEQEIYIANEFNNSRKVTVGQEVRLLVQNGETIHAGDKITEGVINPHDLLKILGWKETQNYLVNEVQKVYQAQGVDIHDKHIEVIVRQMLHKVKIEDTGDTEFLPGELVDMNIFERTNAKAIAKGKEPAVCAPLLLGITKAALSTDSFLSAASFQETTRVLTDAAIKGKVDPLIGLKENVIIGKLIPAGTGMSQYRNIEVVDEFGHVIETP